MGFFKNIDLKFEIFVKLLEIEWGYSYTQRIFAQKRSNIVSKPFKSNNSPLPLFNMPYSIKITFLRGGSLFKESFQKNIII